jgi:hypothetical protein
LARASRALSYVRPQLKLGVRPTMSSMKLTALGSLSVVGWPVHVRRAARVAGGFGMCVVLAGCPQKEDIWIAPGSTANQLTFHLGRHRGQRDRIVVLSIAVYSCAHTTAPIPDSTYSWSTALGDARSVLIDEIRYGVGPPGFVTDHAASRLEAGCYVAQVGTASVKFRVDAQGAVTDAGRPW